MRFNKYIITYFLFGFFLAFIFHISGTIKLLETIISLIIYSIVTFFFYYLWKKFRKKDILCFNDYLKMFIYKICIFLYFIIIIIGSFAYYNNELSPATMPQYTITDGNKVVVFQAMSHIAKQEFYDTIKNNIKNFKTNSGVYFYEGVKQGSKESSDKFDKALGINFTPDLYKNMSKLYGVTFQDNNDFLLQINELDFNVDLNLDEIINIYEKKIKKNNTQNNNSQIINASEEILNKLNQLTDKELKVLVYLNQAILNSIIKNDKKAKELLKDIGNQDLFDVILDERNENLATNVLDSKYDKIYITYGLLHFEGFYTLLKKQNKNWKVKEVKYYYPIK